MLNNKKGQFDAFPKFILVVVLLAIAYFSLMPGVAVGMNDALTNPLSDPMTKLGVILIPFAIIFYIVLFFVVGAKSGGSVG